MKKSIIKKTIHRKIQTAPYESLDINVDIEEEIEWETAEERMSKTKKVTQVLIMDFLQTYEKVVTELKVKKSIANIEYSSTQTNTVQKDNTLDNLGI